MADKKPTFEEILAELERIIADLESGELTLNESLERYERGVAALKACRSILDGAEQKIQLLLRTPEGELKTEPFEPPANNGQPGGKNNEDEDEDVPF